MPEGIEIPVPENQQTSLDIKNLDQLQTILQTYHVDTSLWGQGTANSQKKLFQERTPNHT